jgi:DNA-directed RNA polymerase subunit RPC12/RpoP
MEQTPKATRNGAGLPMPGLYRVQRNQMLQAIGLPILFWALPWPPPLRLVGIILPPLALLLNLAIIALIRCPACQRRLMVKGLTIWPRRRCPHCGEIVA